MKSVNERKMCMVQPVDFNKPVYNAVNIKINRPEIAKGEGLNDLSVNNDSGIYNAVKIDIDNPKVTNTLNPIYNYPQSDCFIPFDLAAINKMPMPAGFPITTYEASFIEYKPALDNNAKKLPNETNNSDFKNDTVPVLEEDSVSNEEENKSVIVPEPNYTTVEAEKKVDLVEKPEGFIGEKTETAKADETKNGLSFRASENVKRPEIVPSEPILPPVDIQLVTDNLSSNDADIQAQQMEEIVRLSVYDKKQAEPYLVRDVFTGLVNIVEQDVTKLAPPTKEQVEARQKLIADIIAVERDGKKPNELPYNLSDKEIALASELSPMELAERNKEYAITTLGTLANLFIEQVEEKDNRIAPITDVPGVSTIVDALRKDPDSGVKLAAIDALRQIQRTEYKEELTALYNLAKTDRNPVIAKSADKALSELQN